MQRAFIARARRAYATQGGLLGGATKVYKYYRFTEPSKLDVISLQINKILTVQVIAATVNRP